MRSKALLVLIAIFAAILPTGCNFQASSDFSDGAIVLLGGDTHFGESYGPGAEDAAFRAGDDPADYARGLKYLRPLIARSNLAIINLETPFSPLLPDAPAGKKYIHWTNPEKAGQSLAKAGVDVVGLANNHTMDQGAAGLRETFVQLEKYKIASFGAGQDIAHASEPLIRAITLPGGEKRILALFAMFEERPAYRDRFGFYAGQGTPGVAPIDVGAFGQQVTDLRLSHPNAYVVAFPHWGRNYSWATRSQTDLGRQLVGAGADIVIGQHAHTLQEIERFQDKWILYGIGNFLFNAPGRYGSHPDVQPYSLVVELSFSSDPDAQPTIRLHPFLSDNLRSAYQPRPAGRHETNKILSTLQAKSRSIGFRGEVVKDDVGGPSIELRVGKFSPR